MVAATETPDSARERLEQARDGAEWGRGEVARLWVRGIEAEGSLLYRTINNKIGKIKMMLSTDFKIKMSWHNSPLLAS